VRLNQRRDGCIGINEQNKKPRYGDRIFTYMGNRVRLCPPYPRVRLPDFYTDKHRTTMRLTNGKPQSYLNIFKLEYLSVVLNGSCPNNTIAPLGLINLLYCFQSCSKGIIVSHAQAVVPYGKSHKIISIDPSGSVGIISRQSP